MNQVVAYLLGFGSYEGETQIDRGRRRIVVGALWISLPFIVASSLFDVADEVPLVAILVGIQAVLHLGGLILVRQRPLWIVPILSVVFAYDVAGELLVSYLYGGLVNSGGTTIWSLIAVLAALTMYLPRGGFEGDAPVFIFLLYVLQTGLTILFGAGGALALTRRTKIK